MTEPEETRKSAWDRFRSAPAAQFALRWTKRLSYRIFRLSGELFGVVMTLGIIWLYGMSWLLTQQSMDLAIVKPWVAQGFAQAFEGADAEVETLGLRWLPDTNRISLEARDVVVRDSDGKLLQAFPKLRSDATLDDMLALRPQARRIELEGGSLTYLTREDGTFVVGLGTPETVGQFGPAFRGRQEGQDSQINLPESFERLSLVKGRVFVVNEENGVSLAIDIEDFAVQAGAELIDLTLIGSVAQDDTPALLNIRAQSNLDFSEFEVAVQGENLRPHEIAPQRGRFKALRRINAPIDLVVEADHETGAPVKSALVDMSVGKGEITGFAAPLSLNAFNFAAELMPGEQMLDVKTINLDSPRVTFDGEGKLTELGALNDGDVNSSPVFDLIFTNAKVDATPIFEKPFELEHITTAGQLDFDGRTLGLSRLAITDDDYTLNLSADAALGEDGKPASLRASGNINGRFMATDLVDIWPVKFADGARSWMSRAVLQSQITPLSFKVDLDEAFFKTPQLTSERFQLNFGLVNSDVRYISTMTPLLGVGGVGRIDGNAMTVDFEGGDIGGLAVGQGQIEIPQLTPKGGDIIISFDGAGKASDMMSLINQKPFQFMDRYGVDPLKIGGTGTIQGKITRPLLVFFDRDRISYEVTGQFKDAVAPFQVGKFPITQGDVSVSANKREVSVSGPANIGPWRADIDWREYLGDDPRPTSYQVSGWMDRDTLDDFGFGLREFFDGRVKVDIDGLGGDKLGIASGTVTADLTEAELTIGETWSKSIGEAGTLKTTIDRSNPDLIRFENLSVDAPGLGLTGQLDMATNFRLIDLDLSRAKVDGLIDAAVQLKPDTAQQRLSLFIQGAYLNVSPWTDVAMNSRSSALDIPLLATASIEQLVLKPGYDVAGSRVLFTHTGQSVSDFRLAGTTVDGPIAAQLVTNAETQGREVTLSLPEASKAVSAFLGLTNTREGRMEMRAKLPPLDSEGAIVGQAIVTDFKMLDTPFLAQILSLASLTGMSDMLGGEGLRFKRFEVPFTLIDNEIKVRDARLYGPVLGMTGDGEIALDRRVLDFDGTLVPAYTANSILGDIPLVGDIFVGKKGSGVLAMNYTVRGPFEKTQISVNPLSALTPGFLRGIFKPSREKLPDEVMAEIEAVKPKEPPKSKVDPER